MTHQRIMKRSGLLVRERNVELRASFDRTENLPLQDNATQCRQERAWMQPALPHQAPGPLERHRRAPRLQAKHGVPDVGHRLPKRDCPPLLRQLFCLVLRANEDVCVEKGW